MSAIFDIVVALNPVSPAEGSTFQVTGQITNKSGKTIDNCLLRASWLGTSPGYAGGITITFGGSTIILPSEDVVNDGFAIGQLDDGAVLGFSFEIDGSAFSDISFPIKAILESSVGLFYGVVACYMAREFYSGSDEIDMATSGESQVLEIFDSKTFALQLFSPSADRAGVVDVMIAASTTEAFDTYDTVSVSADTAFTYTADFPISGCHYLKAVWTKSAGTVGALSVRLAKKY
jgi:hypothetical protein